MECIGTIGSYKVYWDKWSGAVNVGMEHAGRAFSQAAALEVARHYVQQFNSRN